MADLSGKTLFISGASRGIGLAIAKRAAADGANIAIAAKTTEPHPRLAGTIYTAAEEIQAAGGNALTLLLSLPFLWNNFLEPFQQQRVLTYLNPDADPYGTAWNITQSKIAIGSGGIDGKGYQEGSQAHLDFLPETETDFIFAVIAEEFGFIGVCILLSVFFFILLRCLYLAFNARDRFCRLTIGGLSLVFASTLFINLAMVVGVVPVVGMPLPFISKGGSSLLSFYIAFGIIISMATHKKLMQK